MTSAQDVRDALNLVALPEEGGWWAQTHLDSESSAIYYLLEAGEHSKLHRLHSREIYHYHAGAPLDLLVIHSDGEPVRNLVGGDISAGQRPQFVVPAGSWQGSTSTGDWTLVGTTMAPPFVKAGCEFATRNQMAVLAGSYPGLAGRLRDLA